MKFLKVWAIVALLCGVSAVSLCIGRNYEYRHFGEKTYNDACRMSDLIRCYDDMVSDTLFRELQNEFLDSVKLDSYTYCY